MTKLRKAVLPVAGLGTRILPATKVMPKEMLPVFDRPALQYVIDEAVAAGIEHFIFVTGRNKQSIEDYFDQAYELEATLEKKGKTDALGQLQALLPEAGACSFVRQQAPLGLGHAIWCARDLVGDEPFAVLLPDMIMVSETPCLAQMSTAHAKFGGNILAVEEVPRSEVSKYGIVDVEDQKDGLMAMKGMVEKPSIEDAPSNFMISGRYILEPDIFELLSNQAAGTGGEIQLTDSMARLMQSRPFKALPFDGRTYDTGSKLGYLEAFLTLSARDSEWGDQAKSLIKSFAETI
jgi:UTP--glucose-1-phosphate uridylyltransferase